MKQQQPTKVYAPPVRKERIVVWVLTVLPIAQLEVSILNMAQSQTATAPPVPLGVFVLKVPLVPLLVWQEHFPPPLLAPLTLFVIFALRDISVVREQYNQWLVQLVVFARKQAQSIKHLVLNVLRVFIVRHTAYNPLPVGLEHTGTHLAACSSLTVSCVCQGLIHWKQIAQVFVRLVLLQITVQPPPPFLSVLCTLIHLRGHTLWQHVSVMPDMTVRCSERSGPQSA